tara:strand:+ start:792 stop:989 length:198 start_codon:yes stop_codon:yes gene_type:complete
MKGNMKPHQICKRAGLKSLVELSEKSGVSIQTLNNWAKNKPKLFKCLIYGAIFKWGFIIGGNDGF